MGRKMKRIDVRVILNSWLDFEGMTIKKVIQYLQEFQVQHSDFHKLYVDREYSFDPEITDHWQLIGLRKENDTEFAKREVLVKKEKESMLKVKEEMVDRERKLYEKLKKIFEKS